MSYSNEERQRIIREARENVANRINPPSDEEIIARAIQAPIESPMDRWRRQADELAAAGRQAKAELRAEERAMRMDDIVSQLRAEFDAKLQAAIEAEHQFMIEIVGRALSEYGDKLIEEARGIIKAQMEKMDLVHARLELRIEELRSSDPKTRAVIRAVN